MKKAFQDGSLDKGDSSGMTGTHPSSGEKAFHYLFSYQNSDGGWGTTRGDASTVLLTAMVLISLKECPEIPEKIGAVNKAVEYLLAGQYRDGGFGDRVSTVKETAAVYNALKGILDMPDVLGRAREFISSAQSNNGSWNDDVYSTVLAIEASRFFGEDPLSGPGDAARGEAPAARGEDLFSEAPQSVQDKPPSLSEMQVPIRDTGTISDVDENPAAPKSEVRERAPHTKISLVSRRKASASAVSESSDPPAGKDVLVQSVNTDRKKYLPHETVYIYSTVGNRSDTPRSIVVNAQIADSYGHIVDAASHDTNPSVNLSAGACEPVTLSWHTGVNPPGLYNVRFHVADAADGRILDERKISFSISPAIVIEDLSISANSACFSANETETVGLKVAFQNRSNTDAPLKVELVMKDPEGSTVHQDLTEFDLPASAPDAVVELDPISCNFKKCGKYTIEAAVRSGNTVCSRTTSVIHVHPAVRIEAARSLDPSIVTPDGDKAVRIGIRLEGVGSTANASIVRAETNTIGDIIYITCDKAMADPTGNESSFSVTADKVPVPVRDIWLDMPDITTYKLSLDTALAEGQEITISCSSEDLTCIEGKPLMPFNDERVVNKVSPPVFNQDGYGFSGLIPPKPLAAKTVMTGYSQWPAGFRKDNLAFTGAVFDGQCIWMVPANAHSIVKIDKNTGEMTAHGEWPAGFRKGNLAFTGAVFDGQAIWMVPLNADSVIKIDKKDGTMTSYNKWPEGFSKGGHAFSGGVFDGTSIWMIPSYADSVVKIDIDTGRMARYNQWPDGFAKGGYAFSGGVFDGRYVWMIPANADSVIALDTLSGEMKRYNAWPQGHAMVEYAFSGGVFDGRYVWMVPYYSEQVIRIDSETGEMTGHHRRPKDLGKVEYAFAGAVFDGQAIWMVPLNADRVIRIDKDTSETAGLNDWPQGFHKGVNAFAGGVFDGDCIWMIPSYADRALRISSYSSMSVSANITSNDSFFLYVSQDESEEGALVGKGQGWGSIHSVNASLVPGVTNYIHVKCVDEKGPVAAFIADFTLNDPNFHFTDGTQKLVTSEDHWRVYLDKFGGILEPVAAIGKNGLGSWSTRFGIDLEANWIWTRQEADKGTRYFSTPIYYSSVPIPPMEDIHVTSTIGGPGVVVDQASFTRGPSRLETSGPITIAEWNLKSFRVGQREDVYFNVRMLDPVPEEERVISDSLRLTYKDAAGVSIQREFGPCHVHVLPSSFISSVNLADNVFAAGDNVNIGCCFKNISNADKTARLSAVIEDADGSVIKQASREDIQFPPGEDKRIDNILLDLTSAIPGNHRARVILSDGENQLAEASADFVVVAAHLEMRASENPKGPGDRENKKEETGPGKETDDFTDHPHAGNFEAIIMAQPSPIYQGLPETVYYKISSTGRDDLTFSGLQVEIAIRGNTSRKKSLTFTAPVEHHDDGSCSGTFSFSTGKLEPGIYIARLMVSPHPMAEPQEIASTQFAIRRIDVVVT